MPGDLLLFAFIDVMVAFTVRAVVQVRKRYWEQRAAEARRMFAAANEMLAIARRHLEDAQVGHTAFDLDCNPNHGGGVHGGVHSGC